MDSIKVQDVEIKVGDIIKVYTAKGSGSDYNGEVTQVDPGDGMIFVKVTRYNSSQPHRANGWYTPKVSASGIPYVKEVK